MSTYSILSDEARKRNAERATAYNRDKAKRITLKMNISFYQALMSEIEKSDKSMNKYILEVLKEHIGYSENTISPETETRQ